MSFYDDASLVVIPSAQKTSKLYAVKPTDGSGDLAFTRTGDTATRVNSAGLIEKVRTNLVLQSNTFSTTWINSDSTETGGQAGYDGTNNAWLLTSTILGGFIYQTVSISGQTTFSVYAKAGSQNGIILYSVHVAQGRNFNLSTGAVGGAFVAAPDSSQIQSVGNGWYRCSITVSSSSTNHFRIYVGDGSSTALGNVVIQNSQCEKGDIATVYIPTTTAAVSVGPVANVPRLDYLNSTCPRLLLEPQRTNLYTFSEQFNNAAWTKTNTTVTANTTVSPDGYQNADTVTISTAGGHNLYQVLTVVPSTQYTFSFYAKRGTATALSYSVYNSTAGANIIAPTNYYNQISATDWTRFTVTFTTPAGCTSITVYPLRDGASTGTCFLWGAQVEAGAYATSYIPTLAASATRGADACSKTGISSLIGQTEGTLFYEFSVPANENLTRSIGVTDGTVANRINISVFATSLFARVDVGGVNQVNSSATIVPTAMNKVAFRYKANDFAAYVNGVKVITDTSGSTFSGTTLSSFSFIQPDGTSAFSGAVKQVLFFKTALIDAELATLTAL